MTEKTTSTELTNLPAAQRAAIVLDSSKAEAQLRDLVIKSAEITTVIDPAGREEAHRAGMTLKNARTSITKTGKAARDDANAFAAAVIAEEKRLIALIEPEEKRVLALRDAFDAKVAAEKAEKERLERERVSAIRTKIDAIRQIPATMAGEPAEEIQSEINALRSFVPDTGFAEFADEARAAAETAIVSLQALFDRAQAQEREAARLAAERAELERLRAEAAEQERRRVEEHEALMSRNRAAIEAEEQRLAEARAAIEAERQRLEAVKIVDVDPSEIPELIEEAMRPGTTLQIIPEEPAQAYTNTVAHGVGMSMTFVDESGNVHVASVDTADLMLPPCEPVSDSSWKPGKLVFDTCYHTGLQFRALADKVEACGFKAYADDLRSVGASIEAGDYRDQIAQADAYKVYLADLKLRDASAQACEALSHAVEEMQQGAA